MKGLKSIFVCSECNYTATKWLGQCPACKSWNTFIENEAPPSLNPSSIKRSSPIPGFVNSVTPLFDLVLPRFVRSTTGLNEFDRVLGGGLVTGSVVLLAGEPGIGKSTLLTQISASLASLHKVLYVSGEESATQIKLRADRLSISAPLLFVLTETNIDRILSESDKIKPDIIIVDSIQTVYSEKIASIPGSISQVKESALYFINKAKSDDVSIILVGHVNKEGGIAGPKVLEHMVDAVLYFEGERNNSYRIIRAVKNRFGSTNEIGVFQMTELGLLEIPNPSEALLADRPKNVSGNCAVCVSEGSRIIIAEIQALATPTVFPSPRRTSNGIDYNKMCLLLAVLEKRLGLKFSSHDTYLNVIGGLKLDEPATDLAVALALISSIKDAPVPDDLIAFGEIGLSGECRAVSNPINRIKEASSLGFHMILLPQHDIDSISAKFNNDLHLIPIRSIFDLLNYI